MTEPSEHFTWHEATYSVDHPDIVNVPDDAERDRITYTARRMESIRHLLGDHPIHVDSWFRGEALNTAVGGVSDSAHRLGYAVDFQCPGYGSITDVAHAIANSKEAYDQLIWEYGTWVHVSFDPRERMQILTKRTGQPYTTGLPPNGL